MESTVAFKDLKVPFKGQVIIVVKVYGVDTESVIFATEHEKLAKFFCDTFNNVCESTNYLFRYRTIDIVY